jgi:hypothetical protein
MTNAELMKCLKKLRACGEATSWVSGRDLAQVWESCHRGDWMLWLIGCMAGEPGWPTRQQVVLAVCDCAETALQFVKQGEDRPRKAIETARAWARGEASLDEVRADAYAAYAAAADAAYAAAAYAAYAAAAYADADAYADAYAAADGKDISRTARQDTAQTARAKALATCAEIVRRAVPRPFVATAKIGGVQ